MTITTGLRMFALTAHATTTVGWLGATRRRPERSENRSTVGLSDI
jgi:hypothetical protein